MPGWDTSKWGFGTDILGLFGNSTGVVSSGMALWGDSNNQEHNDTINSMGVLGGLSTMINSAGGLSNSDDGGDIAENVFGMGSGIFNTMGGITGLAGRGDKNADKVSNVLYGFGGGFGTAAGLTGIINTVRAAKKNKGQGSKLQTATGLLSSGGGMLGGIGGMLMGFGGAAAGPDSDVAKAGKWLSLIGSGAGMIGNVINLFAKGRAKKKAARRQADDPINVLRPDYSPPSNANIPTTTTDSDTVSLPVPKGPSLAGVIANPISHPPQPLGAKKPQTAPA